MKNHMRIMALAFAMLALAGCQRAAEKAESHYEFLEKSGSASDDELCRAAQSARDAWSDRGDGEKYKRWQVTAFNACQDNGSRY